MSTAEFRVQGVPISRIAEQFGTPLFVYDADVLRSTYRAVRDPLHPAVDVFYSLKSNPNVSVCGFLGSLGAGAEVSSLAELRTAARAGVAPEDTIFLGPGKTRAEIDACVAAGIHAVICESLDEIADVHAAAAAAGRTDVGLMLRVNPDFHAKGSGLAMGGKPRQFGIDVGQVRRCRDLLDRGRRHVRMLGFHVYLGTRFLNADDLVRNTREILAMVQSLADDLDVPLRTVDIGGGFGVAYFDNEKDLDLTATIAGVNEAVASFTDARPGCRVICELGRYLSARCGTYVVRARYVKESMGERFVIADGGTNHHMAAVGIGSFVKRNFPIRSLTRYDAEPSDVYTVTGPLCTPNDVIGKRVALPPVCAGDLIGVERSGAYGPSASPGHFLGHGFPAEVLVHDGTPHLVRQRDDVSTLLDRQRLVGFGEPTRREGDRT